MFKIKAGINFSAFLFCYYGKYFDLYMHVSPSLGKAPRLVLWGAFDTKTWVK